MLYLSIEAKAIYRPKTSKQILEDCGGDVDRAKLITDDAVKHGRARKDK